ncbi:MAG TPA: M20/M25/M40 family metallo-hydrolase, partial [Saprospiraceae bacterium]|nr:M20/M25/M40 family metallo-hydrolase [Saprospiraceae bacterium]
DTYRQTYSEEKAYQWLTTLCKDIGHRLSGSPQAEQAVEWAKKTMDTFGLDQVYLQPAMVTHWLRGDKELVTMKSKGTGKVELKALALGNSIGTGPDGVSGEVIEVHSIDELKELPDDQIKNKIVFFNRPMDKGLISTFAAYGGAADQRYSGPKEAAIKGASAVVIRSLCSATDDHPHTGSCFYADTIRNIPAVALSTKDADVLTRAVREGKTELFIRTTCQMLPEVQSFNVIGEIEGSVHPDQYIIVGGHLDSWDVGDGAHDDGAGCVQSMEVLYRLKKMGYQPKHTIRCVLFMNEENGLKGAKEYARVAQEKNEYHVAAIESDAGGGPAQSFGCTPGEGVVLDDRLRYLDPYISTLLGPYDLELKSGGGGADIGPLKPNAGLMIGLRPESARYFEYHHAETDVLENVHPRELASGSAALISLILVLDQYGIGDE